MIALAAADWPPRAHDRHSFDSFGSGVLNKKAADINLPQAIRIIRKDGPGTARQDAFASMKRARAFMASCLCWLLVAASGVLGLGASHPPPRVLQVETTPTEVSAQLVVNATANSTANDELRSAITPSSTTQLTGAGSAPSPSSAAADRINEDTSVRRDQGLSIEGAVGIAAGCVVVVALAVAFVHVGSANKRKKQAQQSELMTQDLASSTMSVKESKYIESLDASSGPLGSPRTSTIAALRKPTVPHRLPGGGSMYTTTTSQANQTTVSDPALVPSNATSTSVPHATAATIINVDEHFSPYPRSVRTFSRAQRAASGHAAPLSPDSYLKQAQSNSRTNSRRTSRHSRAIDSPSSAASTMSSTLPLSQRSRLRFTRKTSPHSGGAATGDESAADIPMLGGGGGGLARSSTSSSQNDPTSPRDIPVLARGSEESVESVEDDDVEISI